MRNYFYLFFSLLLLAFAFAPSLQAQKAGYDLKFKVKGITEGEAMLAYHYGKKQYISDTTVVDAKGNFQFKGTEALPGGIYLIVLPDKSWFELIVDKEQHFSVETDKADVFANMKITGSKENQVFYNYQGEMKSFSDRAKKLTDLKAELKDNKDSTAAIDKRLEVLNERVQKARSKFVDGYPDFFFPKVLKIMEDPTVPEAPADSSEAGKKTWRYLYFKKHFFDGLDFTDERLLRTPVFETKIKRYMKDLVLQIPDSVIKESNMIIDKTLPNDEMFKFSLITLFNMYVNSKIMGMDAAYVNFAERYYLTPRCSWADSTFLAKMKERVGIIKPLLLGKIFPRLTLNDLNGEKWYLHSLNAEYTVVMFYDYDCGHCKKEIPKMFEIYNDFKKDNVDFAGVCIKRDKEKLQKFVNEQKLTWHNVFDEDYRTDFKNWYDVYSTPVVYLLDADKKIVAKRIDSKGVKAMLDHFIRGIEIDPASLKEGETTDIHEEE